MTVWQKSGSLVEEWQPGGRAAVWWKNDRLAEERQSGGRMTAWQKNRRNKNRKLENVLQKNNIIWGE